LDELKVNYDNENVVYNVEEISEGSNKYFKLVKKGSRRGRPAGSKKEA
jgi:hypothetical protein